MKEGKVHQTLKRLARALAEEAIPYAIVGGMALNLLGYTRETVDVGILLTPEGLDRFRERLVGRGYAMAFAGAARSFRDTQTQVKVEALVAGEYPGDGKPKPVAFPDPAQASFERDGYQVITLEKLIDRTQTCFRDDSAVPPARSCGCARPDFESGFAAYFRATVG